ncbi:type II toxin-antitoxin system YafQ family toxin [Candidatus Kaiserbacteria bacterium]|nr:MAG: type II toxin-antitoxin system YafQ family toxin [Candidatus Kaiserbacteria bacterium]
MIQVIIHKKFLKQFRKLPRSIQEAFRLRRDVFLENRADSLLHVHELHGSLEGYKSFNVNADIRVVFKDLDGDIVIFTAIGSHSELYE